MFCRIDAGWRSAVGASAATSAAAAASTITVNLTAERAPWRVATMTAMMASAGQAVYFIAHATPRTRAAITASLRRARLSSARPLLASSASARQVRAMTGGSVIPIVSGNAMTGQASQNAACPSAARRRPSARGASVTRNVAYSSRNVPAISQGHVLPGTPSAPGRPKSAITGRYGL